MRYRIHSRAFPWIGWLLAAGILALPWSRLASFILFAGVAYIGYFFREPLFNQPSNPNHILSPAWGKVTNLEKGVSIFSGQPVQRVSIFLNIFDVHLQYVPYDCAVSASRYKTGQFINAMKAESTGCNEQNQLYFENAENKFSFSVTQIAGLIARRILCWASPGDSLQAGTCYGLIQFGSRVDIELPETMQLLVSVGQKVQGGLTPLAAFSETTTDTTKE